MLSPKIAQNFLRALSHFEHLGQDDWADLIAVELDSAVQKCTKHSCLRCAHACITVEAWFANSPGQDLKSPPKTKVVGLAHRGCELFVRLDPTRGNAQCFSLADEYFFCPWEKRTEAGAGASDA